MNAKNEKRWEVVSFDGGRTMGVVTGKNKSEALNNARKQYGVVMVCTVERIK